MLKPALRAAKGNPGRNTAKTFHFAVACAAIDALAVNSDRSISQIEHDVARKVGIEEGKISSWRKALNAGTQGAEATAAHDSVFASLKGMTPKEALRSLEIFDWRALRNSK